MDWLLTRSRRTLALLGYEYPASYFLIAQAGYVAVILVAAGMRIASGLGGIEWLAVAAAVAVGFIAIFSGLLRKTHIFRPMLTILTIATVGIFWIVPMHADAAALLLVISVTMATSVATVRGSVFDVVASLATVAVGVAMDRIEQGWLIAAMVCFGVAVGRLLQAQLLLLRRERQARASRVVLDRAGMAREIHDVVAHSLSIVLLNVTGARRALQEDGDTTVAVEALVDAETQGRAAMADVRRTIELLRTDEGGPELAQPGVTELDDLVDAYRRAGSSIKLRCDLDGGILTSAAELAIYRIVQESIANATQHSPGVPIEVAVSAPNTSVQIVVTNDIPNGHRRRSGGSGLSGMRARAELLGGHLSAGRSGSRWRVEAVLPSTDPDCSLIRMLDDPTRHS